MPLRVGTPTGSTVPKDIRVGAAPVKSVHVGTATGEVELWRRTENTLGAFTVVTADTTLSFPAWAQYVDIVAIGAGGSGHGGNVVNADGQGGSPGAWAAKTMEGAAGQSVTVTVGKPAGGDQAGGATTVSTPYVGTAGTNTLIAAGGAAGPGYGNANGTGAGTSTAFGVTFTGGGGGGMNNPGAAPGGGGGGGDGWLGGYVAGASGGRGQAWVRFRAY